MTDLIYKEESYRIIGAAMEVYNEMGSGFLEPIYQESFALELASIKVPFAEQVQIHVFYKGTQLKKEYKADYIAYDKIILEIKAQDKLTGKEDAQLINYLKATKLRLGLLINFGNPNVLEWKRIVH